MINLLKNLNSKIMKKKSTEARKFALKHLNFLNTKTQYLKIFNKINNIKN